MGGLRACNAEGVAGDEAGLVICQHQRIGVDARAAAARGRRRYRSVVENDGAVGIDAVGVARDHAGGVVGHRHHAGIVAGEINSLAATKGGQAGDQTGIYDLSGTDALDTDRTLNGRANLVGDRETGVRGIDAGQVEDKVGNIKPADGPRIDHRQIGAVGIDAPHVTDSADALGGDDAEIGNLVVAADIDAGAGAGHRCATLHIEREPVLQAATVTGVGFGPLIQGSAAAGDRDVG